MKILISWSGPRSRQVGHAIHRFLGLVIQATEPWMSDRDISVGTFWHKELWDQLESGKAGVICMTPEMITAPWVHFEAGALAKAAGQVCVCPYLFDFKSTQLQGPLTHLQWATADQAGTLKMMKAINSALGKNKLADENLLDSFEAHWPKLEKQLNEIGPTPDDAIPPDRTDRELLEELLNVTRDLQSRTPPPIELRAPSYGLFGRGVRVVPGGTNVSSGGLGAGGDSIFTAVGSGVANYIPSESDPFWDVNALFGQIDSLKKELEEKNARITALEKQEKK